jgi:hypothetical protein
MTARESVRVSLELDSDSEPIAGRLYEGDGAVRAFVGWLSLFAVIESVLAEPGHTSSKSTTRGESS